MKVLSTEGLTKLIDLIKSSFISNTDTEEVTEIDTETVSEVTLATVATTGAYSDLSGKPTVDQTYDGTSANAQSGVAVASAISGRANTNLSNISNTATKSIDGQWILSHAFLANTVSWTGTGTTYSLSSYLPNDGNDYEVIFGAYASTAAKSGKFIAVALKTDIINNDNVSICQTRARSNAGVDCRGSIVLPVGTGRTVTQYSTSSSNAEGTYTLEVYGYRRIGTNS